MPEPETVALDLTCAECGRSPRAGEVWRVLFADLGEAVTYCPKCGEREFGQQETGRLDQSRERATRSGPLSPQCGYGRGAPVKESQLVASPSSIADVPFLRGTLTLAVVVPLGPAVPEQLPPRPSETV
jgi:hypothetical protein